MTRSIKHQFHYTHPPEVVWEYLTDSELLGQWLMVNDLKPVLGHKFQFKTKPRKNQGFDGTIYCEILEIDPPNKLVYSWQGGKSKDEITLDTIVTWILTPTDDGTLLSLEHSGFKGLKNYVAYFIMNLGWIKIGRRLSKKIDENSHVNSPA